MSEDERAETALKAGFRAKYLRAVDQLLADERALWQPLPLPLRDATIERVSLPSAPVVEETPAEETREPSGWRDRPAPL